MLDEFAHLAAHGLAGRLDHLRQFLPQRLHSGDGERVIGASEHVLVQVRVETQAAAPQRRQRKAGQIDSTMAIGLRQRLEDAIQVPGTAAEFEQVAHGAAEVVPAVIAQQTIEDIRLVARGLEGKPGDVKAPGIANDPDHRQRGQIRRDQRARQVVADAPGVRQESQQALVDECAAGFVQVQEDEAAGRDHPRSMSWPCSCLAK